MTEVPKLETRLKTIEKLYNKAYSAISDLSIELDRLEYNYNLSEWSAELVEEITEDWAELDQEYNRQWDRFTDAHNGGQIVE